MIQPSQPRILARLEGRHWLGLGASLALHAVMVFLLQVPAATPKPVTFEIALVAPEAARLPTPKARRIAEGSKPRPKPAAKQHKREADTLDLAWKHERHPDRETPSVALPQEHPLGLPDAEERPTPQQRLARTSPSAAKTAADSGGQGLSEPDATGQGQFQAGQPGRDAGVSLTPAQTLALVSAIAAAGAQPGNTVGQATQAAAPGQSGGSLAKSESGGGGNVDVAGSGAASSVAAASQAASASESQGIRLSASTALGGLAAVTPNGNVVAAPVAGEFGRAGASATSTPSLGKSGGGQAGPTVSDSAVRGTAKGGAPKELPQQLVGSGAGGKAIGVRPGRVATGQTQTPASSGRIALAPGVPSGSGQNVVALQPVIAVIPSKGLATGGGHQHAAGGQTSASGDGPETSNGGNGTGGISDGQGRKVMLQRAKVTAVRRIPTDTEAQPLDVLAPSTFCPLPGHQPDNRAPKPDTNDAFKPAYAADNPSLYFPTLGMLYRTEGRVTARVEVLADGKPGQILLKQSSGYAILDKDALDQLTRWHFVPAQRNGQAVSMWIDVPVIYRLPQTKTQ